jgi:hypothetical protein
MKHGMKRVKAGLAGIAAFVFTLAAAVAVAPQAAADDTSVIAPSGGANFRSCPRLPAHGVTTGECAPYGRLPQGTPVTMNCWVDTYAPPDGDSPRWFWVTVRAGEFDGLSGWVWSDLVGRQKDGTPNCGPWENMTDPERQFVPSIVELRAGPPAPHGLRYAIAISGFAPDSSVTVGCFDSVDYAAPFYTFTLYTDSSGAASTASQCYSGDGPDHWVEVDGIASNVASW